MLPDLPLAARAARFKNLVALFEKKVSKSRKSKISNVFGRS